MNVLRIFLGRFNCSVMQLPDSRHRVLEDSAVIRGSLPQKCNSLSWEAVRDEAMLTHTEPSVFLLFFFLLFPYVLQTLPIVLEIVKVLF